MKTVERENILDMAHGLSQEVATRADSADRTGKLPAEDVQALKESGYTLLSIPREYGGYGLPMRDCAAAQLELAQGSASTAMVAAMQMQVFGTASEQRYWPEALFEKFCRASVQDGALFNVIASEPLMGSPSRGGAFQTYANLTDDGWVINGHKNWATGGKFLTHILVKLNIGDDSGMMLIPGDAAGIEWVETWRDVLSLRASDSHDVYFNNVTVPLGNLVERVLRKPEPPNAWFAMSVTSVYLGAAIAARNAVIQFALERVPTALGKPIATLPKIQRQIGEIDLALQAAQTLLLEACAGWTGDTEDRKQNYARIVAAKTLATETAEQATMKALRIAGGSSITHDLPLERYFRDSQAGFSHPPSGDAAYEAIGQNAINTWKTNLHK
ncbi:MAG: acyl-CoA dehydrogenase family protein [Chloroflexota bacterium]